MDRDQRSRSIFGNSISEKDFERARKAKEGFVKEFGDDSQTTYHLQATQAPVIGSRLDVRLLQPASTPFDLAADAAAHPATRTEASLPGTAGKPLVIGNIRMGFGHYRISMAIASAARALGYTPYWFDLCGFPESTCTKIIQKQNKLYSMGSRLSQKVAPFNKLYWEPLNSEGFRQLSYNASDQMVAQLFTPVYADLPTDVPFVSTHAWTAQGAVHAGMTNVVTAICDNWPMALHLAEGSIHTVQTPGAYLGYKMLRGMDGKKALIPMPAGSLVEVGHYIDHELVANIADDCNARMDRMEQGAPVRYLVCVGGAGAQFDLVRDIIKHIVPLVETGQASLMINVGDHENVWKSLRRAVPQLKKAQLHFDDFDQIETLCADEQALSRGVHAFCNSDIFGAVYSTNLLMRKADVLVTKPSELAFYPVPKLTIHRVGGHEAWGAIRAAELGDGTYELETAVDVCAMIDAMQTDRSIIMDMCDHIIAADSQGIYDGAYRAVRLATRD